MANSNIVFNIAKGRVNYYLNLVAGATGALKIIPIEATGLEDDTTLADYTTVSTLLAGSSNEQTTVGRKTASSVAATADNSNDRQDGSMAAVTWTAATGNGIGALVVAYDPTGSSADSALVPLTKHVFAATPDGNDLVANFSTFVRAS